MFYLNESLSLRVLRQQGRSFHGTCTCTVPEDHRGFPSSFLCPGSSDPFTKDLNLSLTLSSYLFVSLFLCLCLSLKAHIGTCTHTHIHSHTFTDVHTYAIHPLRHPFCNRNSISGFTLSPCFQFKESTLAQLHPERTMELDFKDSGDGFPGLVFSSTFPEKSKSRPVHESFPLLTATEGQCCHTPSPGPAGSTEEIG